MSDYAKKKNDELAALCKERGLAHTGKKADLVKRLEDHDVQNASAAPDGKPSTNEDEIDWDDEPANEPAKGASTEAAANAVAAGGKGQVANPQAVPNQQPAIDPAKTNDLSVAAAPADGAEAIEKKEEKDYSTGLAERSLKEEIEKRKARARKFGLPEDSEEIKSLERALRFGTTDLPGLLNKALPQKQDRKRGSDNEHEGGARKRNRQRPGQGKPQDGGKATEKPTTSNGGYPTWMTDKDREAADRRKAKFSAT